MRLSRRTSLGGLTALVALLALWACGEDTPAAPEGQARIEFSRSALALGTLRDQEVTVRNRGTRAAGPVELAVSPIRDRAGGIVPGSELRLDPEVIPTLNPGDEASVRLSLTLAEELEAGEYDVSVEASAGSDANLRSTLALSFVVRAPGDPGGGGDGTGIVISGASGLRQGDVEGYQVRTGSGDEVSPSAPSWTVIPSGAGFFGGGGRFVAYEPGTLQVVATLAEEADTLTVEVEPRGLSGSFSEVGTGEVYRRHTSDLWVHGSHAYTGTWGSRTYQDQTYFGNTLNTWDVSDPTDPRHVDALAVDARVVNDVKIRADGELGVITHEASNDARNGITILDLSDPSDPEPITRYTRGLESGVHNVWIDGDYVYVVLDGTGNGLRILEISNPASPTEVAGFYAGSSFLHDVYVRDGLAFLSHWDAGLVVLDVGNGMAGGSPESPVEVGRVRTEGGNTHNAWYWPESGYVFVGEENFGDPGMMHVVDLRDPENPREVAGFAVPGQTPHNFWLDESRGVLYLAWYGHGIRALDVNGELLGDLGRQGREIAGLRYAGAGCGGDGTCAWAPQLHQGLVFLSDMNAGLVVLEPQF